MERICGVCTGTHALASVHAIEDALKIDIPDNANIIRNLMQLALWYHDHLVHFYQLGGLDWIDVVSASKADPKEASRLAQSLSPWPQSSPGYFASVKEKLVRIISTGQLGIFKNCLLYTSGVGLKHIPEPRNHGVAGSDARQSCHRNTVNDRLDGGRIQDIGAFLTEDPV